MKLIALPLSLFLVLGAVGAPTMAQDDPAPGSVACLRVTTEVPAGDLTPTELGQLLIDGEAAIEIVACEPAVIEPTPTATPMATPEVAQAPASSAYVTFVAQGAGAAVELAALAKRHEDAKTLRQLDAAARGLAAWARSQRTWLDNHPPRPCYASVHKQWRKGTGQVLTGAKAVRQAIATLKPAPMRKAVRQLAAGARHLADVDLDAAYDRCASTS